MPAIALTAFVAVEVRRRTATAGFGAHVAKPAEPAELAAQAALLTGRKGWR